MPTVEFPDGSTQDFPDDMPMDQINVWSKAYWQRQNSPPQTAAQAANIPAGSGIQPGPISSGMPPYINQEMPPLSDEAKRARNLLMMNALSSGQNRGAVSAAENLQTTDPSYQMRKKAAELAAADYERRKEGREAGAKVLQSFAQLQNSFDSAPDEQLLGAIGARNTTPLQENSPVTLPWWLGGMNVPGLSRPTTVDPSTGRAIAGQLTPVQRAAIVSPDDPQAKGAWTLQNLFGHDVHSINTAMMASAGKGINPSDARQQMFDSLMRDFMRAPSREAAQEVLNHAKASIANDFFITPQEADAIVAHQLKSQQAAKDIVQGGAGQAQGSASLPRLSPDNADAEYQRLQGGTHFIDPQGRMRVKPRNPNET